MSLGGTSEKGCRTACLRAIEIQKTHKEAESQQCNRRTMEKQKPHGEAGGH